MKHIPFKALHLAALFVLLVGAAAQTGAAEQLQIYFIDVEGGQATLIVTPQRETLLIDAGWAGEGSFQSVPGDPARARDPGRIVSAMRDADVERIDYLLVTHFHRDHMGGVPELAQLVPIGTFIDYGSAYTREQRAKEGVDVLDVAAYDAYLRARARSQHLQPMPGDRLPLKGVAVTVVSADRKTLNKPLRGAGSTNGACKPSPLAPTHPADENPRSLGIVLEFGSFRLLNLGDLTGQPLYDLVCPSDRIGEVSLYVVAHHGNAGAADPATLAAFKPRVALVNNAPRKGGRRATLQMLDEAGTLDSWQLHISEDAGEYNAPSERIANLDEASAHWLKVTASKDGAFTIANPRTRTGKHYEVR